MGPEIERSKGPPIKLFIMNNKILKTVLILFGAIVLFGVYCVVTELYLPFIYPFKHRPHWNYNDLSTLTVGNKQEASKIMQIEVPFSDGSKRRVLIYLPKGYDQTAKSVLYPTYYLLHGSPDDETAWEIGGNIQENLDQFIDDKKIPPIIAIMPDGNGGLLNDTQYIDSTDGKELNETFIAKNLVDYIDLELNTKKDAKWRAIGGLSSGGFGAINIGLKHQDRFGYIQSFSGYSEIDVNTSSQKLIQHSRGTIWANSPRIYLKNLSSKNAKIFLGIGKADDYYGDNVSFNELLLKDGYQSEIYIDEGWHSWIYWKKYFLEGLGRLGKDWLQNGN